MDCELPPKNLYLDVLYFVEVVTPGSGLYYWCELDDLHL